MKVPMGDFAELVGKSRGTIASWVRAGMPIQTRSGHRGAHQVDVQAGVQWALEHVAAEAAKRVAVAAADPAREAARTRKIQAEARVAELNARQREGELVEVAEIEPAWARLVLAARAQLIGLPDVARQRGIVDVAGESVLEELIYAALTELSQRGTATEAADTPDVAKGV